MLGKSFFNLEINLEIKWFYIIALFFPGPLHVLILHIHLNLYSRDFLCAIIFFSPLPSDGMGTELFFENFLKYFLPSLILASIHYSISHFYGGEALELFICLLTILEFSMLWAWDKILPFRNAALIHCIFYSLWLFQSAAFEKLWPKMKHLYFSFVAIVE